MEPSGPSPRADPRRALPPGAAALSSRGFALVLGAAFWLVGWPSGGGALAEQKAEGPGRRSAPEDARAELLKINYIFNRQLYEIAIPRYLKLLEAHPDFEDRAMVHHALALCYHSLARPSGAEAEEAASDPRRREHLESAVRHAKLCLAEKGFARRAEALDVLARDLLELGRSDEAARAFETLAAETEGEAKLSARLGLGEALYRRGDYPAAAKTFREIIASLGAAGAESSGGEAAGRAESRERASYHLALALYRQGGDAAREARDLFGKIAASGGALREDSTYMSALCEQSLGNHSAALEGYERLLGAGSRRWQEAALFGAGAARFHLEQYEACASSLETLLQKHPSTRYGDQARLYLGRALMKTGNLRSGAILLNELRRSAEVGAEASLWLARAYSSVGKHSQAIKIVEAAIGKFPSSPHREILELELAIELVADRRFDTALEVLARFSERAEGSPHRDHAAYLEGFALHQAGDRKASLEVCRRFLSEHAASPYLRQVRQLEAENLFLTGGYAEAAELYRRYLDEFAADLAAEERLLASYRIGEARFFEGAHEDAIRILDAIAGGDLARDLEKALAGNPLFASYRYLLGEASYRLEDYRRAARELEAYLDAHPDGSHASDARFKRAHALHLAGETEAAAAAYREAVEAEPRSPHRLQIHFELAQLALETGDRAAARESFREVVAADPASPLAPHACHYLGWIAHQESRPEEAVQWFRKLVDGYPQHERH
ncbi:MAG: tetratricopeptide repeat protein, partial [Planctomycetes bacterium]|nr:tetratricopeptide repeat protein [Planctomycetota bacterium]